MTNTTDLWKSLDLASGLTLELRAGTEPCLTLLQGEDRISVELSNVKTLVAGPDRCRGGAC